MKKQIAVCFLFPVYLIGLSVLSGCSVFSVSNQGAFSGNVRDADGVQTLYEKKIVQSREKKIREEKKIVICCQKDISPVILKAVVDGLKQNGMTPVVMFGADKELFSMLLRRGKVDLIGGRFTQKEIRSSHLCAVLPYKDKTDQKEYCFAIREEDGFLKKLLEHITMPGQSRKGKDVKK